MKLSTILFIILIIASSCNSTVNSQNVKSSNYDWVNKSIGRQKGDYSIRMPADYSINYSSLDSTDGVIQSKGLRIDFITGYSLPKIKIIPGQKIIEKDTVGSLIVRISSAYMRGDEVFALEAWDTANGIIWDPLFKVKKFNGIDLVAKNLNNEQKDTVMKIFNSLMLLKKG